MLNYFLLVGIYSPNSFCTIVSAAETLISHHLSYQVCLADVRVVRCLSPRPNTVDHVRIVEAGEHLPDDLQSVIENRVAVMLILMLCRFLLAFNSLVEIFVALGIASSSVTF